MALPAGGEAGLTGSESGETARPGNARLAANMRLPTEPRRPEGGTMASIYKEIIIDAAAEQVWAAMRDVGAVHERLAPGFVADVRLEHDARIVTFADGRVIRELIVGIDDTVRRLAYAAVDVPDRTHHNASFQVFATGDGSTRLVWITDVLPDAAASALARNMERGLAAAKRRLEEDS
jgi:hypothetical protein